LIQEAHLTLTIASTITDRKGQSKARGKIWKLILQNKVDNNLSQTLGQNLNDLQRASPGCAFLATSSCAGSVPTLFWVACSCAFNCASPVVSRQGRTPVHHVVERAASWRDRYLERDWRSSAGGQSPATFTNSSCRPSSSCHRRRPERATGPRWQSR
jgi:hypothetical protein